MIAVSSNCIAIANAAKAGTLKLTECPSRFGGTFVSIADDHGTIEVADDMESANARVAAVKGRING